VEFLKQLPNFLARFEERNFLRLHFHAGAGFRIASGVRSSVARAEAAESTELNALAALERPHDATEDGLHNDGGLLIRNPYHSGNLLDQLHSVHSRHLPLGLRGFQKHTASPSGIMALMLLPGGVAGQWFGRNRTVEIVFWNWECWRDPGMP